MNLKALIEKRNALLTAMQDIVNAANTETRAFTNEELADYEAKKQEIEALDKTISAMQEYRDLDVKTVKEPDTETKNKEQLEVRAFENLLRGTLTPETRDTDNPITFGDNGAIIPSSIANKIIDKVVEISPIYALANRYNVGGTLTIPYYDTLSGDITMDYSEEFTSLTSTGGRFKSISLKGFLAGVLTLISQSLINNSNFDIVDFVINKMATNIARWLEKELINGTASKVEGLSTLKASVTAASATKITADELIDLQESIPDIYQAGAVWIMNKKTRTMIRKLKDSEGKYILNRDMTARWGYTLFGKDIYISDNMPEAAAKKRAIIYGDLKGLAVKVSEDVSITVLRELYATQHAIGVCAYMEIDSKVENAEMLAVLDMAAT